MGVLVSPEGHLGYFDSGAFQYVSFLMGLFLFAPLVFIALDYWAGVRKARQRGEVITSSGMQRTIKKVARYYNALLALVVVDTLLASSAYYFNVFYEGRWPVFPFLTLLGTLGVSLIEVRSIYEAAETKEKRAAQDVAKLLTKVLQRGVSPQAIATVTAAMVAGENLDTNDKEQATKEEANA